MSQSCDLEPTFIELAYSDVLTFMRHIVLTQYVELSKHAKVTSVIYEKDDIDIGMLSHVTYYSACEKLNLPRARCRQFQIEYK